MRRLAERQSPGNEPPARGRRSGAPPPAPPSQVPGAGGAWHAHTSQRRSRRCVQHIFNICRAPRGMRNRTVNSMADGRWHCDVCLWPSGLKPACGPGHDWAKGANRGSRPGAGAIFGSGSRPPPRRPWKPAPGAFDCDRQRLAWPRKPSGY
jgi:hypothetical protein